MNLSQFFPCKKQFRWSSNNLCICWVVLEDILFWQTYSIDNKSQIDPDVFKSMSSLGCFKDKHALTSALLCQEWVLLLRYYTWLDYCFLSREEDIQSSPISR